MATVSLKKLTKRYGNLEIVHGIDLDVADREFIALVGPSGSGKTTLLRILGGLEVPTSGRVLFDGQDATGMSVQQRRAGFVFQHYALFRHMTVFENIAYGLRARPRASRPTGAEIDRRVNKLLGLIQLPDIARRYPAQLSGGQRQRVALARALAIEPRMLLLDEPFGALDARVRKELRAGLREIHDQTGLTTVFVTHDQDEAMELADRVVVMSMGRIEQIGTPSEIRSRPATKFVAEFIDAAPNVPVGNTVELSRFGRPYGR
jgi:sulfate transport system ATP-binding protein